MSRSSENGVLRANERLRTDDEARRVMAEMSPKLEQIYCAARLLKVRWFHLGVLRVEDLDTGRHVANINGAERKLRKRACSMIFVAIAWRQCGAFFNGGGCRMRLKMSSQRLLREAMGLHPLIGMFFKAVFVFVANGSGWWKQSFTVDQPADKKKTRMLIKCIAMSYGVEIVWMQSSEPRST